MSAGMPRASARARSSKRWPSMTSPAVMKCGLRCYLHPTPLGSHQTDPIGGLRVTSSARLQPDDVVGWEFAEDRRHRILDRLQVGTQIGGDLSIRAAVANGRQHLTLERSKAQAAG